MIEAKYTTLYKEWLLKMHHKTFPDGLVVTNGAELYDRIASVWQDQDMASALTDMLYNVYEYYEVGDDDEMFQFMYDTFCEYSTYYKEIIDNYSKEYQYELNNKRVVTKSDALNISGNNTTSGTGSNTDYELPNKVIPENQYRNTPTSITDNENSSSKTYQNATSRASTYTTEFNNEFIDLKNKYMNQIRNVYREFAMKFKDCFYQIY